MRPLGHRSVMLSEHRSAHPLVQRWAHRSAKLLAHQSVRMLEPVSWLGKELAGLWAQLGLC